MNMIGEKMFQQLGIALGLSSITLLTGLALTVQAKGGDDDRIIRTGNCSKNSDWKLKAKSEDNGRIEVEFEVDQNVVGRTWGNVIKDNGRIIFRGNRVTQPPSGSYSIEFLTPNRPGNDVITATARNRSTGELCSGSLVF